LWLLDASILLTSEDTDDDHHRDSCRLLEGNDPLATLDLAFYEGQVPPVVATVQP